MKNCGDKYGGYVCDREPGHPGEHRGYNPQIDEAVFWPAVLTDRVVDAFLASCERMPPNPEQLARIRAAFERKRGS
jgi:hypothetical protein